MSTGTAPALDATFVASDENNRVKGFLGTSDELTLVADTLAPHSVAWVRSLSDAELLPLGERALHDIADDILVLDEIRQRFRRTGAMMGYAGWKDFVERNSRYTLRTIQRKLADKNGRDESKINYKTGNMYTRPAQPVPHALRNLPQIAERVRKGHLQVRPTVKKKATGRNQFADTDYYGRIGRGLRTAFSGVDERLKDLIAIKQNDWTDAADEGTKRLILTLREVAQQANDYAAKLKATRTKRSR